MNPVYRTNAVTAEKNCDSVIEDCNNVFIIAAGLKSKKEAIGKTDYDFPWFEFAGLYRAHELDALEGNNYSAIIPFVDYNRDYYLFLHTKILMRDKNKTPIGISCHAVEIVNPNLYKIFEFLRYRENTTRPVITVGKKQSEIFLPKKQSEVLFYLSHGKSTKSIAKILNISFRTVEHYLDILKNKLRCNTKSELIAFAIKNGYAGNIPSQDIFALLDKTLEPVS